MFTYFAYSTVYLLHISGSDYTDHVTRICKLPNLYCNRSDFDRSLTSFQPNLHRTRAMDLTLPLQRARNEERSCCKVEELYCTSDCRNSHISYAIRTIQITLRQWRIINRIDWRNGRSNLSMFLHVSLQNEHHLWKLLQSFSYTEEN